MYLRIANDTAFPYLMGLCLKLRFYKGNKRTMRRKQFKRCRKNSPNTRKGYIADSKVERGIKSLSGKIHYVGSLVQVNAFIVSKRPVKLGMTNIDRNHATSAAFIIIPFALPGWTFTPRISQLAAAALKVS